MYYEDYKVLTDEEYEKLNNAYLNTNSFNRNEYIFNVCTNLHKTLNMCNIKNNLNYLLNNEILNLKQTTQEILNKIPHNCNVNNEFFIFNIFSVLENLNECISQLFIWLENENKEYHREFIKETINKLLKCNKNIISALKNSNIKIFKYM